MHLTQEQFLNEVKTQAYRMHCAAARGNMDEVRQYFDKLEALRNADRYRERVLQHERMVQTVRQEDEGSDARG